FTTTIPSRNNEKHLIFSIAYQLALSIPATQTYIESVVQNDPEIINKSLEAQIERLIIRPLQKAYATVCPSDVKIWPRLIVIDGLDECHGPSIQCSIIHILSTALCCIKFPLILLIASSPEPHIRKAFNLLDSCCHIVLNDSYKPDALFVVWNRLWSGTRDLTPCMTILCLQFDSSTERLLQCCTSVFPYCIISLC
ncbi:hypothetical protein BYT27DRAFT_7104268, partial [Phlegmacium glaucopus]